jgi:hypothetical protein
MVMPERIPAKGPDNFTLAPAELTVIVLLVSGISKSSISLRRLSCSVCESGCADVPEKSPVAQPHYGQLYY